MSCRGVSVVGLGKIVDNRQNLTGWGGGRLERREPGKNQASRCNPSD